MAAWGDHWNTLEAKCWPVLWEAHVDSVATRQIIDACLKSSSVIEIGGGPACLLEVLRSKGWSGRYIGYEISEAACQAGQYNLREGDELICADFLDCVHDGLSADVVVARGVVHHQAHWMPMVLAALTKAPRVIVTSWWTDADHHEVSWNDGGIYNVHVSLDLLKREARAVGLNLVIEKVPRPEKLPPNHQEALLTFWV